MQIVAVPNVSEGRDPARVQGLTDAVRSAGARVLDVHSDAVHHRSVLTVAGRAEDLVGSLRELARAARTIDLRTHDGAHPRLGGLDVCPIVAEGIALEQASDVARAVGRAIASDPGLPVYLYGAAAARPATAELPDLRRGGLRALARRARAGLAPDFGPREIDLRTGVVCVGARGPLIAFNVWLRCDEATARAIAGAVRTSGGGPPGVRALGLRMGPGVAQVSMNLVAPDETGIDAAFEAVARAAADRGERVLATEIVGLVASRHMPDPERRAARLLRAPGRSLESLLAS